MKVLEKRYTGISRVERDYRGALVLPDISETEIGRMLQECENEAG